MLDEITQIFTDIGVFIKKEKTNAGSGVKTELEERDFILLLSGLLNYRTMSEVPEVMKCLELHPCQSEEGKDRMKAYLKDEFQIVDYPTMLDFCDKKFSYDEEYRQFQSFWSKRPVFDINTLKDGDRAEFEKSMELAEGLRKFSENGGFYAWDCNERIGLYRKAFACGYITEEQFFKISRPMAKRVTALFDSWYEYAVSCLCGAVYFKYRENGRSLENLTEFFEANKIILEQLLAPGGDWDCGWHEFSGKKFGIRERDIRELLGEWPGGTGCMATDRILVDGCKVCYMYREEPYIRNLADSGWRFFAGDESDEYVDNPDNIGIYHLNTLCNYDPDIMPHLHAAYGKAYFREKGGIFVEEELRAQED